MTARAAVGKAAARAAGAEILARFEAAGAVAIETDILQPAGPLLDLYGEDIRARAFVKSDPLTGEQMLRPDFTVPVARAHMSEGAEPARYTYVGEVFRKQEEDTGRASETLQVGFEVFDRRDPAAADAEVFALFQEILAPEGWVPVTGDMGLLRAAVAGLGLSERRRAALMRHIWRPGRFQALLDRFGGRAPVPESRARMVRAGYEALRADVGPAVGLRSEAEVEARIVALVEDAREAPLDPAARDALERLLALRGSVVAALADLEALVPALPGIAGAVAGFAARLEALRARGVDLGALAFDASHGRTAMEYYDGFVFGFARGGALVASGGRYDALTRVLGEGREIPAVGGVIRPGILVEGRVCA